MLERPLHSLAGKAVQLELSALDGMHLLPAREGGAWEKHVEDEAGHGNGDEHGHGEMDTHLWLSPHNARLVVEAVTGTLINIDPTHAPQYQANAETVRRRIDVLEQGLTQQLAPVLERRYIVFHDAYQYFEEAFGLHPAGAIAVSPDRRPGARRIVEIRGAIKDSGAICVFSEPQFRSAIVDVVLEGSEARHGVLDPLGASLSPGKEQWFALMQGLADGLASCLSEDS